MALPPKLKPKPVLPEFPQPLSGDPKLWMQQMQQWWQQTQLLLATKADVSEAIQKHIESDH